MEKQTIYIIAEIGINHNGNLNIAKKLIDIAKVAGCDVVKFQKRNPDICVPEHQKTVMRDTPWGRMSYLDYKYKIEFDQNEYDEINIYCKERNIHWSASPWDLDSLDFLNQYDIPFIKIPSALITNLELLKATAETGKKIIISTGMASIDEIELTYKTAKRYGAKDITLLYCVSNYPSKNTDFNLNNIQILKNKFKCRVGLSDHSKDDRVAITAIAAGAEVVEKHIALDKQKKGLDIEFSLKGKEIRKFKENIDLAYNLLGKKYFYRNRTETKSNIFRRSIFVTENIKKGEKFNNQNIRRIRPGYGLEPKYYEKLIGKKSPVNLKKGETLKKFVLYKLKINN